MQENKYSECMRVLLDQDVVRRIFDRINVSVQVVPGESQSLSESVVAGGRQQMTQTHSVFTLQGTGHHSSEGNWCTEHFHIHLTPILTRYLLFSKMTKFRIFCDILGQFVRVSLYRDMNSLKHLRRMTCNNKTNF